MSKPFLLNILGNNIEQARAHAGFHPATKIWGGSAINEWAYSARQVPWDVF